MKPHFSGWATKAGLTCTDGLVITPDAFKHQDQVTVPLLYQHGHTNPKDVLGHAILTHKPNEGVWVDCYFNESENATHMKHSVHNKDITMMSIWANQLIKRANQVIHGVIREVSLVLAGANPGATIESVSIQHANGDVTELEDEGIIHTGLEFEVGADDIVHEDDDDDNSEKTIEEVYESMTDEQKEVTNYLVGVALESKGGDSVEQSSIETEPNKEGSEMVHQNVFEGKKDDGKQVHYLAHDDIVGIMTEAQKKGNTLKSAVEDYALAHGIHDIEQLFPDAKALDSVPEWIKRRTEWVGPFLAAVRKSPFSRIKTQHADLTQDEARAKGYIKGTLKKEQFFSLTKRTTAPTTVYKKQKLDRDDIIDITDFDVVAWIRQEMRFMLDEEIARAILIGDGREVDDEDKIKDPMGASSGDGIRSVLNDDDFYVTTVNVQLGDANSNYNEVVDAIIRARRFYKGTGTPNFYTTEIHIAEFLTLRDEFGHRIYKTLADLALEMRVSQIIPVEILENETDVIGIMLNPSEYVLGADKGGQVSFFDDFDIDYNQEKYLIETRVSGALVKAKTAMVIKEGAGVNALVTPAMPAFDPETGALTITNQTGVVYKHGVTIINAGGSPYTVDPGESWTVVATPASGYDFPNNEEDEWTFTADA